MIRTPLLAFMIACLTALAGCGSEPPEIFKWLDGPEKDKHEAARTALREYGCVHCHTIGGVQGAHGLVGPPLVRVRERVYIGGMLPNTEDNLTRFIIAPAATRPGSAMPMTGITEPEARAIARFLYSEDRDFMSRLR